MRDPGTDPSRSQPSAPSLFADDVRVAGEKKQLGKLGLLGLEARQYAWKASGLELATNELMRIGGSSAARIARQLIADPIYDDAETVAAIDRSLRPGSDISPQSAAHAILFTGHMIDAPGRATPRFPARAEAAAREAIRESLLHLQQDHPGHTVGVAGGASGGDLLFHEVCAELNIETFLRLTAPQDTFLDLSVVPAGPGWGARFHALVQRLGQDRIQVLGESLELPGWMTDAENYDAWQRTNLWLVQEAIGLAPERSLLALWDGKPGDGPGGTQHLVEASPQYGITVAPPIQTSALFNE